MISISIDNKKALEELGKINKDIKGKVKGGVIEAAMYVQGEVKRDIADYPSVDTGRFLNSIEFGQGENEEVVVYTDIPYAPYLEYGTSKMKPRSHFRNTAAKTQERIKEVIAENIKK